jgi:hypothetical protein
MSKRKKRSRRATSQAQRSISLDLDQVLPDPTAAQADPSGMQEYEYVTKDLKRVGILAAALFALLFALSFFIG